MTSAKIQAKEHPIRDVFCEKYFFRVPNYQRPYSWELEHARLMLNDFLNSIGKMDTDSDDIESYFLGSIVVVKDDNYPDAQIIDGQQRLTTLTILLSAIRSLLSNPEDRMNITKFIYNKGNPFTDTPDRYHLELRARDAEFFRDHIQKDNELSGIWKLNDAILSDSCNNIVKNARYYAEFLKKFTQTELSVIAKYILTKCYLIVVLTQTLDSAYRIFSILNDRGLDLSYADILKAEVIGKIESTKQDSYTKKWEDAEVDLGREGFKDFLGHVRSIYRKTRLRETILKEIREYIVPEYSPQDFIDKVVLPFAEAYGVIKTASYESGNAPESINNTLTWLNRIDNSDWTPCAMSYYERNKHAPADLKQFVKDLERLAASMMIRREDINYRQIRYGRILAAIANNEELFKEGSPLQLDNEEIQRTIACLDGDIYHLGPRVYILRRLDAELSENKVTPELPLYTIEHVLPQHPDENSEWLEWYPDDTIREEWLNRVGNLALLSRRKNSQAQNYEFDKKKKQYFNTPLTPFALTTQIIGIDKWTPDILSNQQKQYLSLLKNLWRLEA